MSRAKILITGVVSIVAPHTAKLVDAQGALVA
jgi:hypothetical protein